MPISATICCTYVAIVIVWAKIQTIPSDVGIVVSANAIGTAMLPSVPNMKPITTSATSTAIDSPRARSWLLIERWSSRMAGNPVR